MSVPGVDIGLPPTRGCSGYPRALLEGRLRPFSQALWGSEAGRIDGSEPVRA
jgi:hypothetical protein